MFDIYKYSKQIFLARGILQVVGLDIVFIWTCQLHCFAQDNSNVTCQTNGFERTSHTNVHCQISFFSNLQLYMQVTLSERSLRHFFTTYLIPFVFFSVGFHFFFPFWHSYIENNLESFNWILSLLIGITSTSIQFYNS